ncbi:polysaccharide deacetylase family protein [Peribacillus frigoritolerans]|uniref:polysaccharide deacetylase family protein n=1 Tax=Peribacillus frigoritolerans TaxID=450367 RepID=UPI00222793C2|nr:polysaccharide deacetylase family protein [Peribacillus frigoritolerans]UYZ01226.1 polysaccharide deacetylase family protein [Peribacillus frigoritolerans]
MGNDYINFGNFNTFGTPTRNNITGLQVRVKDNAAGPISVNFNSISAIDEGNKSVVSITMDDGWLTQYTEARPSMDKHGFPATTYLITDVIGNDNKFMTMDMLKKLRDNNGWEMAAHAYTMAVHEAKYINVSEEVIDNEFRNLKNWLVEHGFHSGAEHFAFPGGAYNKTVLSYIRKYFGTARTISETNQETLSPADPHRLRIFNVLSTTTLAAFQAQVDKCLANNTWLILCYHQFTDPATASTQVTPTNFAAQMDYLASKGIPVRTIGDVARHGV